MSLPNVVRRLLGQRPVTSRVVVVRRCAHCGEETTRVRVIVGLGARALCDACERVLVAMGFDIRSERRHARRY